MRLTKKINNKGVSTVVGTILFIILFATLASALFIALSEFNKASQTAINIDQSRNQEKMALKWLTTDSQNNIVQICVNNFGSIATTIRAVYIDDKLVCDPSQYTVTYMSAHQLLAIDLLPKTQYSPNSRLAVATERSTIAIEYEWVLKGETGQPSQAQQSNFGPLQLNYDQFEYSLLSANPPQWQPGWNPPSNTEVIWRINVNNTDNRDITLNKYSCLTLVTASGPSSQLPWYIEIDTIKHFDGSTGPTIHAHENFTSIVYKYGTPLAGSQKVFASSATSKVFLTFFGIFHETDGRTKPYGQTIPFEAVVNN